MSPALAAEIQAEQDHGRSKHRRQGGDVVVTSGQWAACIDDHNERALLATPRERRQHLIKIAGLAVSAVEAFDARARMGYGDVPK